MKQFHITLMDEQGLRVDHFPFDIDPTKTNPHDLMTYLEGCTWRYLQSDEQEAVRCGTCKGTGLRHEWRNAELVAVEPQQPCPQCTPQ